MKVSVYIPCFNAAETIKQCLDSVFRQSYHLEEVIVIDDVSSDDTLNILSQYPVKVIRHKKNSGLAACRNTAIKNIQSQCIASLDADCQASADWVEILMSKLEASTIVAAGGRLEELHTDNAYDHWRSVHMKQHWGDKECEPLFLYGDNTIFKRNALLEAGPYNEDFRNNYDDVDM